MCHTMQIFMMVHGAVIHLPLKNTSQQHHWRMTSATWTYKIQNSPMQIFRMLHGTVIHLPLKNTSQQHHWKMTSGPKIQFWIDSCSSMKDFMSHISSVPTSAITAPQPLGWIFLSLHHRVLLCLTTSKQTSVTSQIFLTS